MFKKYWFRVRGKGASALFRALRWDESMVSIAFSARDETQKADMVRAARPIADAERAGEVQVNKYTDFDAYQIHYRKSRSGYQLVLSNIPLGWESNWGPSFAENRCPVCGWPLVGRTFPREITRNASSRLFTSMDGYLIVWHEIMDRLEREEIRGVRFVPVQDPDVNLLTLDIFSGSFEVNRRRLLEEFPAWLRSSGTLQKCSEESTNTLMEALECAIDEQFASRAYTPLGTPEDDAWVRLAPWLERESVFKAFRRFCASFEQSQQMSFSVYPPPPTSRESKWYAVLPDTSGVPEHERTVFDPVTACPECGLRAAVEGPLRVSMDLAEGQELFETSSGLIVASDRICKILSEYDRFPMSAVELVP
jgi:hypothetical protein